MTPAMRLSILNREGMNAMRRGDFMNAMFILNQALMQSKHLRTRVNEARVRNNLALACRECGHTSEAIRHLHEAGDIVSNHAGTDNSLYRSISRNLATINTERAKAA